MNHSITLRGLDGSNPLAFLAALGTFRVLTFCGKYPDVRLSWEEMDGGWRPKLWFKDDSVAEDELVDLLHDYLSHSPQRELLEAIGPNLTISGGRLRVLSVEALDALFAGDAQPLGDRLSVCDFLAAFGCDAITTDGDQDSAMQDTAFRTMSGAGHQHFVSFMLELISSTDATHLHRSLFETWDYQDSGRGANMRWDPADDRRYALRWKNPSADPNMTMRGANRLGIEALPLFTTVPIGARLETVGFVQRRHEGVRWTWPIWSDPIDLDTCRSLLQSADLEPPMQDAEAGNQATWREILSRRGFKAVFQSQRITTGKFRNFTPSRAL